MKTAHEGALGRRITTSGVAELFLSPQRGFAGLEKLVVIKSLLPDVRADTRFVEAFVAQARAVASLQHPALVDIYDVAFDQAKAFIMRDYVSGEDLGYLMRAVTERKQPLPFPLACRIIVQAAAGIQHVHAAHDSDGNSLGLLHGDLVPGHVLVAYTGATKLLDAGLYQADPQGARLDPGKALVRQAYRSPEQLQSGQVDARSDVYTLGVLLYELLTGQPLFWNTQGNIRTQVLQRTVPRPSSINATIPAELDAVVLQAIERDPAKRISSAEELECRLEEVIQRSGTTASEAELGQWMSTTLAVRLQERRALEKDVIRHAHGAAVDRDKSVEIPLSTNAREQQPSTGVAAPAVGHAPLPTGPYPTLPAQVPGVSTQVPIPTRRTSGLLLFLLAVTLLALFCVVGVFVWYVRGNAVPSVGAAATELPAGAGSVAVVSTDNTPASLLVQVTPAGTRIELDGRLVTDDGNSDGVLIPVPPNHEVALRLSKAGYLPLTRKTFSPAIGTKHLAFELSKVPTEAEVATLAQPDGSSEHRLPAIGRGKAATRRARDRGQSEPTRSDVGRDHRPRTTREAHGRLPHKRPSTQRATLSSPPQQLERATLVIHFSPSSAAVSVDGEMREGDSPLRLEGLELGTHSIKVYATGYREVSRVIQLTEDETRVNVALMAEVEKTEVVIRTDPPGANLNLDGRPIGTTPTSGLQLPSGKRYGIELSKAGYETWTGTVVTQAGEPRSTLQVKLKRKSAAQQPTPTPTAPAVEGLERPQISAFGKVQVSSPNVYGEVWINGKYIGYPPVVVPNIPVGAATVELRVGQSVRRSRKVRVRKDETTRVELR